MQAADSAKRIGKSRKICQKHLTFDEKCVTIKKVFTKNIIKRRNITMGYLGSVSSYASRSVSSVLVPMVVCGILAIAGGIALRIIFSPAKSEKFTDGFLKKVFDVLNFRIYLSFDLLKFCYGVTAIFLTLHGIVSLCQGHVILFFVEVVIGNVIARLAYEGISVLFTLVENVVEINAKLKKDKDA